MTRKLTEADEERYARLADWAENADDIPEGAEVVDAEATQAGRALMEELLGSPEAVERAMGRPTVDGTMAAGKSPIVQVRISRELKGKLKARADAEHRNTSDLVRDALVAYLEAS
jgi:hypothetical protein